MDDITGQKAGTLNFSLFQEINAKIDFFALILEALILGDVNFGDLNFLEC